MFGSMYVKRNGTCSDCDRSVRIERQYKHQQPKCHSQRPTDTSLKASVHRRGGQAFMLQKSRIQRQGHCGQQGVYPGARYAKVGVDYLLSSGDLHRACVRLFLQDESQSRTPLESSELYDGCQTFVTAS